MKLTAAQLRRRLARVLDRVAETGKPVEVECAGVTVLIERKRPVRSASERKRATQGNPNLVVGDPDELIHFNWSQQWIPDP